GCSSSGCSSPSDSSSSVCSSSSEGSSALDSSSSSIGETGSPVEFSGTTCSTGRAASSSHCQTEARSQPSVSVKNAVSWICAVVAVAPIQVVSPSSAVFTALVSTDSAAQLLSKVAVSPLNTRPRTRCV